tara:strand:+ start:122 stop:487 length:366 start_codon:yes stop_codon:yes gene_type:complete
METKEQRRLRGIKYRDNNRQKVRTANLIRFRKLKAYIKKFVNKYKMLKGCSGLNCHYTKNNIKFIPEVLHFDHIDPKKKLWSISNMYTHNIKTIKNEIRKCQILCANCHIEKSVKNNDYII